MLIKLLLTQEEIFLSKRKPLETITLLSITVYAFASNAFFHILASVPCTVHQAKEKTCMFMKSFLSKYDMIASCANSIE